MGAEKVFPCRAVPCRAVAGPLFAAIGTGRGRYHSRSPADISFRSLWARTAIGSVTATVHRDAPDLIPARVEGSIFRGNWAFPRPRRSL